LLGFIGSPRWFEEMWTPFFLLNFDFLNAIVLLKNSYELYQTYLYPFLWVRFCREVETFIAFITVPKMIMGENLELGG